MEIVESSDKESNVTSSPFILPGLFRALTNRTTQVTQTSRCPSSDLFSEGTMSPEVPFQSPTNQLCAETRSPLCKSQTDHDEESSDQSTVIVPNAALMSAVHFHDNRNPSESLVRCNNSKDVSRVPEKRQNESGVIDKNTKSDIPVTPSKEQQQILVDRPGKETKSREVSLESDVTQDLGGICLEVRSQDSDMTQMIVQPQSASFPLENNMQLVKNILIGTSDLETKAKVKSPAMSYDDEDIDDGTPSLSLLEPTPCKKVSRVNKSTSSPRRSQRRLSQQSTQSAACSKSNALASKKQNSQALTKLSQSQLTQATSSSSSSYQNKHDEECAMMTRITTQMSRIKTALTMSSPQSSDAAVRSLSTLKPLLTRLSQSQAAELSYLTSQLKAEKGNKRAKSSLMQHGRRLTERQKKLVDLYKEVKSLEQKIKLKTRSFTSFQPLVPSDSDNVSQKYKDPFSVAAATTQANTKKTIGHESTTFSLTEAGCEAADNGKAFEITDTQSSKPELLQSSHEMEQQEKSVSTATNKSNTGLQERDDYTAASTLLYQTTQSNIETKASTLIKIIPVTTRHQVQLQTSVIASSNTPSVSSDHATQSGLTHHQSNITVTDKRDNGRTSKSASVLRPSGLTKQILPANESHPKIIVLPGNFLSVSSPVSSIQQPAKAIPVNNAEMLRTPSQTLIPFTQNLTVPVKDIDPSSNTVPEKRPTASQPMPTTPSTLTTGVVISDTTTKEVVCGSKKSRPVAPSFASTWSQEFVPPVPKKQKKNMTGLCESNADKGGSKNNFHVDTQPKAAGMSEPNQTNMAMNRRAPVQIRKYPSLKELLDAEVIRAGHNVLSLHTPTGVRYASLEKSGFIRGAGGELFATPLRWCVAHLSSTLNIKSLKKSSVYNQVLYKGSPLSSLHLPKPKDQSNTLPSSKGNDTRPFEKRTDTVQEVTSCNNQSTWRNVLFSPLCKVKLVTDREWTVCPQINELWNNRFSVPDIILKEIDAW